MISAILPLVLSVVTTATPTPAPAATGAEPAIRVTLNHQTYNRGDRARVTVRVRDDGYVVVMHTDANGHVRVLFPVDPGDDNFMKAGQDYEIRGRGDRDAFQVTSSGSGTVYAAVAMDPYHFDDFVRNNHWDYARLDDDSASTNDPEAAMTNLAEQMADGSHFDYDVATYTAENSYATGQRAYIYPVGGSYSCFYNSFDPWCDGYYPSPSYYGGFDIGFGFGPFWGYRPYGFGFGFGFPRPGYFFGGGVFIPRGYGATGYGYTLGHGFTHRPVVLGPGGGYAVGSRAGIGFVSARGASPLYGVSRFNTQRGPSRGNDSPGRYGRRDMGEQPGFRTRVGNNTRPSSDVGGMRPAPRAEGQPARAPERVERSGGDSRATRVEPRSEPRAEPRSEPRSEGHSRTPSHESRGGGGGGGGRRGGGGGGGGGHHH